MRKSTNNKKNIKLNIILLTTKTYHHLYFYREISKNFKNIKVIIEKKKNKFWV